MGVSTEMYTEMYMKMYMKMYTDIYTEMYTDSDTEPVKCGGKNDKWLKGVLVVVINQFTITE